MTTASSFIRMAMKCDQAVGDIILDGDGNDVLDGDDNDVDARTF